MVVSGVNLFRQLFLSAFLLGAGASQPAMATLAASGSVVITPDPSTLLRGQSATLVFSITNMGDEEWDYAGVGTGYYDWGPTSTIFPMASLATPPCILSFLDFSPAPGEPAFWAVSAFFRPLPVLPGETRQCVMELRVSEEAAGPFIETFSFTGALGSRSISFGEEVFFGLGEDARPIPLLSAFGLGTLVLGALITGVVMIRRKVIVGRATISG